MDRNISWPGWEVVRRIGNGSFGTVYEIQREVYGDVEKAALKVITLPHNEDEVDYLRGSGLDDRSITQTFHQHVGSIAREYKLMAQLRENPNIVRCDDFRDIQHDDGLGWDIYIKMELLMPLMKNLNCVATEQQIIQLGMDICNALMECQKRNIIHRDIKPQNVFISESGLFKLGDFGIARTMDRATHATAGIGTYSYMAPEVERNDVYGKTADIYSLGLMMYWLLNERRGPFMPLPPSIPSYQDEEQARRRRFSGEPIPAPKNGSDQLKAIVLRACSFRPEDRFGDAAEMFAALKNLRNASGGFREEPVSGSPVQESAVADGTVGFWNAGYGASEAVRQSVPEEDADATVGNWFAGNQTGSAPNTHTQEPPIHVDPDATVGTWSAGSRTVNEATQKRQEAVAPDATVGVWSVGNQAVHLPNAYTQAQPTETDDEGTVGVWRAGSQPMNGIVQEQQAEVDPDATVGAWYTGAHRGNETDITTKADVAAPKIVPPNPSVAGPTVLPPVPAENIGSGQRVAPAAAQEQTAPKTAEQGKQPQKKGKRPLLPILLAVLGIAVVGIVIYFLVGGSTANPGETMAVTPVTTVPDTTVSNATNVPETTSPDATYETTPPNAAEPTISPLEILETVWNQFSESEKFFVVGGDYDNMVDGAPGKASNTDFFTGDLLVPADQTASITDAASLIHGMNTNTFTCAAYAVADIRAFAGAMESAVQGNQWMFGIPERLLIAEVEGCVVVAFGHRDAMIPFLTKLTAVYPTAIIMTDEPIGEQTLQAGVMTHAEFDAAALDTEVTVHTYVQAVDSWWDGWCNIYAQSKDGGYYIYKYACTEEEAAKLVPGTKIEVTGYKCEWAGEVEIMDASIRILEGTWIVKTARDITSLLGSEELVLYMNELISAKGLTVVASQNADGKDVPFLYRWDGTGTQGDDIYFNVSSGGAIYTFSLNAYMMDNEATYQAVEKLKIGDIIDIEGFLYWYEGAQPHVTSVKVVG